MSSAGAAAPLPVVVLGGYLGAGKTTLLNELLRQADGERIAVLVNDFGDIAIDADLIEGASGEVLALAGGCVCCSFGADLVGTAQRLLLREPPPQRVLVECSGVGLPGAVLSTLRLVTGLDPRGVVTVLDASDAEARAADTYVGDTVRQQIRDADRLLLNQVDRCNRRQLDRVQAWLADMAPGIPVCETTKGALPADWLWAVDAGRKRHAMPVGPSARIGRFGPSAADRFRGDTLILEDPVDVHALAAQLSAPDADVVRAKGWLVDAQGRGWLLQVAGGRAELTPAVLPAHMTSAGRVLVIRARGFGSTP